MDEEYIGDEPDYEAEYIRQCENGLAGLMAMRFHEYYENASRRYGWETQEKCRVPFSELPKANRDTMVVTCQHILDWLEKKQLLRTELYKWKINVFGEMLVLVIVFGCFK